MARTGCSDKKRLKKGPWTAEEDEKLLAYIQQHGHGSWRSLPSKAGLERCGKSCRLRWTNYLRPDIKRGNFSLQEEQTIIQLHALIGNRWSAIATYLPNRTDNEIKNYWNTRLKKKLIKMGIDPNTHKPKSVSQSKEFANISHMAQWESARVEAEARLRLDPHHLKLPHNVSNPSSFILNPSNMLSIPTAGTSSFVVGNPSSYFLQNKDVGGIMELDHLPMDHSANHIDQGFPSFIHGFTAHSVEACLGVLEGEISLCFNN